MKTDWENELKAAIISNLPLGDVVGLLRRLKDRGIEQASVYSFLEHLRQAISDEETDDRILEVADFVAGFCSPHMKVWDDQIADAARK
jgi:hypothetical protein